MRAKLQQLHLEMKRHMLQTYDAFRDGGDEVQREWSSFVEQVDKHVEDALRQTVKRSLQELSRSINGDAKTEVQPLFQIHVTLQGSKVEFKPSISELTQTVSSVSANPNPNPNPTPNPNPNPNPTLNLALTLALTPTPTPDPNPNP